MNLKSLFQWIYKKTSNYNLFMLEETDYDDNDDDSRNDPAIVLKYQKYKTRLYSVLLIVCLYILFYVTLIKKESKTIIISNVTPDIFNNLSSEYAESLSCPCIKNTILYRNFVSQKVTMHPVCSSDFVDKQWIQGLYFATDNHFISYDFRVTAYSQFQLLSTFCSFANDTVSQIENDINNTDFVTVELLSEEQIQLEINAIIESQKSNALGQTTAFMNYLKTTIVANVLVSARGMNWLVSLTNDAPDVYYAEIWTVRYIIDYDLTQWRICGSKNFIIPATLNISNDIIDFSARRFITDIYGTNVNGFFSGCTPLEAILESTLDCLYQRECLQLLLDHFPELNQMDINWNNSILTSEHENLTVHNYLNNLFIQNWSITVNYSTYFDQCSPSICTYIRKDRVTLSYSITLFISLYGGLIIILRLFASSFIDIVFQLKNYFHLIQSIKKLNLFKNIHNRTENDVKRQRIITRVYLIFLVGTTCILFFYTVLSNEIIIKRIPNPSFTTYNSLEDLYGTTLQCPCSNKTISQDIFMRLRPTFHQICSSGFIDDKWIALFTVTGSSEENDWLSKAGAQFQLLSDLCNLANKTINGAVERFLSQIFVASSMMNETDFNKQINATVTQFYQSTLYNFAIQSDIIRLIIQVDQFYMKAVAGGSTNSYADYILNTVHVADDSTVGTIEFISSGLLEINSTSIKCICAMDPNCQNPAVFYGYYNVEHLKYNTPFTYYIPGWFESCFTFESLRLSTLQCFYVDSDCFPILVSFLSIMELAYALPNSIHPIVPLIDDPSMTRFPPNTSISTIIQELMVEQWHFSSSYQDFYEACAPRYCSYSIKVRKQSVIRVIITLISLIGGVVVSLRMLTPHFVKFILKILPKPPNQEQQEQNNHSLMHRNRINQLKTTIKNKIKLLPVTLIELNVFTARDVGSDADRVTAKRYGQLATRLYLVSFLTGLIVLVFYTIVQPHIVTKDFDEPSFNYYNNLRKKYGDKLTCSCSVIASTYNKFVQIESVFHSICTSEFVSEEWRLDLLSNLVQNLTLYEQGDYRRFLSAHLQHLQGLCQFSQQSVNNSINKLLTSLFVTVQLLSQTDFENHVDILIEQSKSNAPVLLSRFFFVTQNIFGANDFVSIYGTNFKYSGLYQDNDQVYVPAKALVYDDGCSCGMYTNCTIQAKFIETNSSTYICVKGMKIGCTPSESFLASTLECFYDQSCLDLIQQYTNYSKSLHSISTNSSRFSPNTTISELVKNVFIEYWSATTSYSSYYKQCSPSVCSYSNVENFNIFYTITVILGIQGGLTIVLEWICPKLVRIGLKIYHLRKNRVIPSVVSSSALTTSTSAVQHLASETHSRPIVKIISIISVICISIGIIIFSIYYGREDKNKTLLDEKNMNDLNTTTSTFSTTLKPLCYPEFDRISFNIPCLRYISRAGMVVDLNSDNRFELIFYCKNDSTLNILFWNNYNNTFEKLISYPFGSGHQIIQLLAGDMNNDARIDLILIDRINYQSYVCIIFGNGNGTFQIENMQKTALISDPTDIIVADINMDDNFDVLVTISYVYVYVFCGNGSGIDFPSFIFDVGFNTNIQGLAVGDFNNDSHADIAVLNLKDFCIHIFFGHDNGSSWLHKWIFVSIDVIQFSMISGDFDGNNQSDIVVFTSIQNVSSILYRYDNNTFHANEQLLLSTETLFSGISTGDLNGDHYSDIVVSHTPTNSMFYFLGNEDGHFEMQEVTLNSPISPYIRNNVVDFNNDHCEDIIGIDISRNITNIFLNTCRCHSYN